MSESMRARGPSRGARRRERATAAKAPAATPVTLTPRTWRLVVLLVLATLAILALDAAAQDVTGEDLWWHLATGRYILEHGEIPTRDVFSFTYAGRTLVQPGVARAGPVLRPLSARRWDRPGRLQGPGRCGPLSSGRVARVAAERLLAALRRSRDRGRFRVPPLPRHPTTAVLVRRRARGGRDRGRLPTGRACHAPRAPAADHGAVEQPARELHLRARYARAARGR